MLIRKLSFLLLNKKTKNDSNFKLSFLNANSKKFTKVFTSNTSSQKFHHIKTTHPFHIVDPSPWPLVAALGALMLTFGMVMYMHKYKGGYSLLQLGLFLIIYVMFTWWRDVIREATFEDKHTAKVQKGLKLGVALFIVSEVMFFFSFFWAFFHSSLSPVFNIGGVWPPKAISVLNTFGLPLTNTFLLLTSGASVTWAHQAVLLRAKKHSIVGLSFTIFFAVLFMCLQLHEYRTAPFNISDGIYGSCFYMTTGFHGFHVFVGTIALIIAMFRLSLNHFTNTHHVGLESAIWYWHFVDIVWLFLFVSVYWWGNR
jgi:cytochrome c oxidase subunit 3